MKTKYKQILERYIKQEVKKQLKLKKENKIRNHTDIRFMREITKKLNRSGLFAEFNKDRGFILVKRSKNDEYFIKLQYMYKIIDKINDPMGGYK